MQWFVSWCNVKQLKNSILGLGDHQTSFSVATDVIHHFVQKQSRSIIVCTKLNKRRDIIFVRILFQYYIGYLIEGIVHKYIISVYIKGNSSIISIKNNSTIILRYNRLSKSFHFRENKYNGWEYQAIRLWSLVLLSKRNSRERIQPLWKSKWRFYHW